MFLFTVRLMFDTTTNPQQIANKPPHEEPSEQMAGKSISVEDIQSLLIFGCASFVYKCFLPGPLKKLRFVGGILDQYHVITFPSTVVDN